MPYTKDKQREYCRKWRQRNPTYHREYYRTHQDYYKKYVEEWRKQNPSYASEYMKNWRNEHPEKNRQQRRKWKQDHPNYDRINYPIKYRAWHRAERLERDEWCKKCGSTENLEHHHLNYEEDVVITLCRTCHRLEHKKIRS